MLDRAFRLTLRDLSTYFLIAACVFVPLQIAHALVFRDVIAVAELHEQIGALPEQETVRGVGPGDLDTYRVTGALVLAVEFLLLPLLVAAASRVLETRERGELPSILPAWSGAPGRSARSLRSLRDPGVLITSLVVAGAIGALARGSGLLLIEPLSERMLWAGVGLIEAGARSLAAPFVMVPAAMAAWRAKETRG